MVTNQRGDEREAPTAFIVTLVRFIGSQARDGGQFAEIFGKMDLDSARLTGLRMAARDFVEACADVKGEQLAALDADLRAAGAPTLSAMRRSNYRKILAVLRRSKIRSEAEWFLLNGLLSDTADRTLTPIERQHAEELVHEFEMSGRKS